MRLSSLFLLMGFVFILASILLTLALVVLK